ncbi:MAG: lipopolysaccharide biosynthesis protein, partial [Flavisolibacter sp.]
FGVTLKHVVVDRIFNNSPELLRYYYWTFPFGYGLTIFMVLEAFSWQQGMAVLSNFLKEILFRFIVTVLIVLVATGLIRDFDTFVALYAFTYIAIVVYLLAHLWRNHQFHLTFSVSKVTRRFYRKISALVAFVWGGGLIFNIANVFDTIIIAAVLPNGMAAVAPFLVAQNITSLIQAPQRAVISASVGPISKAWKEKDYQKINRIYHRSSINQLIFSCAMFCLIWLNFEDGVLTFKLQHDYLSARWAFFFLGLTRIIDMGTGVNAQIIGTSTYWRFEFISGVILFLVILPLDWQLTRYLGIVGPAISNLVAFTVYNLIRYLFLWKKFKMQPFTVKTVYTIVLAFVSFLIVFHLLNAYNGFEWIVIRSIIFLVVYCTGMAIFRLSPDVQPVLLSVKKRLWPGR